jgi:hypothetical protein
VTDVRRSKTAVLALVMALPFLALPQGASAAEGFHGFVAFDTNAQGQVATMIGYLGDLPEEDRIVGARTEINGPPSGGRSVAAFVQKGAAASYTYGVLGGPGGAAGVLPQPAPGEAVALYPAQPSEYTFEGPVTQGAGGQVIDSRFYAQATEAPTGRAEAAVTNLSVPGQFSVAHATVVSHSEPADGGVVAESTSTLRNIVIGPLKIESMVSHAYGFLPAKGEAAEGIATTVVEGATVNGVPVQITEQGIVVGEGAPAGAQQQVNAALAGAGLSDVSLSPSVVKPGDDKQSLDVLTGVLRVVHRDSAFGFQYLQGFEGGGFAIGGAQVSLLVRRMESAP